MDRFSQGPDEPVEKTEAAGNFDSRGLGLGSGASLIPVIEPPDQKDNAKPDHPADLDAGADANAEAPNPEMRRLKRNMDKSQSPLRFRRQRK